MKKPFFTGVCTALVTPFLNDKINFPMLQQLINRQITAGIKTIVISGTTGESATLSDGEKLELFQAAKEYAANRAQIIAGTGSNNTKHTVELSQQAQEAGVDALLVVTPYYNKPPADGLYSHYLSVCHNVSLPVIVYNVPSRTGTDIPVSVCRRLSRIPNIAGIKEASTDLQKITKILHTCQFSLPLWSGNDHLITPIASLGGQGVISVLSNLLPEQTLAMTSAAIAGDFDTAAALQLQLSSLISLLFSEPNPIPVKAALNLMGYDCGNCRLPLMPISEHTEQLIRKELQQLGILN